MTKIQNEAINELYLNLGSVATDRSDLYQVLIEAVRYPTYELAFELINGNFYEKVNDYVRWVNAGSGVYNHPLKQLHEAVEGVKNIEPEVLLEKMETEYSRLFLEDTNIIVPFYEINYMGPDIDESQVQQELEKLFQSERFENNYDKRKELSFIGTELEFMHFLSLKEAEAWKFGKMGIAKQLKRKQHDFLLSHVGNWGGKFFAKIVNFSELPIYIAIGMLGTSFMKLERGS